MRISTVPTTGAELTAMIVNKEILPNENALWHWRTAAEVTPEEVLEAKRLREHVQERLGSLKTPETIAIRDEVPQTATGKILRRAVREELAERTD